MMEEAGAGTKEIEKGHQTKDVGTKKMDKDHQTKDETSINPGGGAVVERIRTQERGYKNLSKIFIKMKQKPSPLYSIGIAYFAILILPP